jgi:hypothetical protein
MRITQGRRYQHCKARSCEPCFFLLKKHILPLSPFQIKKYTADVINAKWINRTLLDACLKSVKTAIDSQHEIEIKKRRSYLKIITKTLSGNVLAP